MKNLCLAVACAIAAFAPGSASADQPVHHPAYLHAIEDLRHARAFLERPANLQVTWDETQAIREIDGALREIKDAAVDDGKPLTDHPPIDVNLPWGGRLHQALELVEKARSDVNQDEDNNFAKGLKQRALGHLDAAANMVKAGIVDFETPPPAQHPAYLHAIANLRYARALLERPAHLSLKWDEHFAVRAIDDALHEIREAALDDGKQLTEHPPIDVSLDYSGRLRKADELLVEGAPRSISKKTTPTRRASSVARSSGSILRTATCSKASSPRRRRRITLRNPRARQSV